jgi:hypothetical protein
MEGDTNIKEQLASLQRDTGRIEGKLDSFIAVIATADKEKNAIDNRLRHVENRQAMHTGAASILGAIGGYILTWIVHTIH